MDVKQFNAPWHRGCIVNERMQALLDSVLAEQQAPSLVEEFASWHERDTLKREHQRYEKLLPLSAPVRGQQYAFEVHLDKCSGCKACVTACHSLNGLDDEEAWRETGLLVSDDWRNPYQQVVTTACHHCVDPGCLNGCPVLAYEKDPFTGIVRHLDDQCIGCQYCILKCPYDVPKYSAARGIVRKCDMCSDRLLAGEAPACVQACPNEAIRITIVEQESFGGRIGPPKGGTPNLEFLPDAPDPSITLPTTRYVSARLGLGEGTAREDARPTLPRDARPTLKAADREVLRPQAAHWPLVLMLVLTQLGTGLFVFAFALEAVLPARIVKLQLFAGLVSLCAGLGASIFHLGRPRGAWRAFLGVRRSWLSREIVAFGICLPFAIAYTFSSEARTLLGLATVISALAGVFCSAMVYHDTSREYWTLAMTGPKFFGTTLLLGSAGSMLACLGAVGAAPSFLLLLLIAVMVCGALMKQGVENRAMEALSRDDFSELHKTALLLSERFGLHRRIRVACGIAGGVCFPALLAIHALPAGPGPDSSLRFGLVAAGILFSLAGEFIERWLFFVAVQPAKMPG